jgi:hypothetical protein
MPKQYALPSDLERVIFALCEDTDTERSRLVARLVREGRFEQLVNLKVDSSDYSDPESYFRDAVVTEFLRKFGDFQIPGIDKKKAALDTFFECEKACHKTNLRLQPFLNNGPFEDPAELRMFESIERMQRWLAANLGPLPRELVRARHGPGSTFRDVGKYITVPDKLCSRPAMTQSSSLLLPLWERTWWAKALYESNPNQSDPEVVRGNRFTAVHKNALKMRGICIEGSINVYFQLGIGAHFKVILKKIGMDQSTAQDRHRRYAELASRTGTSATVDLSNASDMNSRNTTRLLLAKAGDWLELLEMTRSPMTLVNGKWHRLEKFSSMGNGYTFELETLIFTAIAMEACYLCGHNAVPGVDVHVFGDDIILPVKAGSTVLQLLKWFGFKPNEDKTFLSGPFRESCGGDFFDGVAVRPHYLEKTPNETADWFALANGIRRLGRKDSGADFRYSIYWRAWLRVLDAIPVTERRIRGPEDLGDLVIHDEPQYWQRRRTVEQKTFIRTWMPIPVVLPWLWAPSVVFASALYGVPSAGVIPRDSSGPEPKDQVSGYRKKWVQYVG